MAEKKDKKQTFNTRLYECCADDELRPILQCVQFREGFAYATNGAVSIKQTLAFQSIINPEMLDGKLLHRDSYKAIMAFEIAECQENGIECKNTNGQSAYFDYFDPKDQPIPNIPRAMEVKRGLTSLTFIGIDPDSLILLNKAIYNPANNLRFQFTGIDSYILVDAVGVDDQEAVMMPRMLTASLF